MKNRRRPTGDVIEAEITLSYDESAKLAEVVMTSTKDSDGKTYAERMREKAERARRAHSS